MSSSGDARGRIRCGTSVLLEMAPSGALPDFFVAGDGLNGMRIGLGLKSGKRSVSSSSEIFNAINGDGAPDAFKVQMGLLVLFAVPREHRMMLDERLTPRIPNGIGEVSRESEKETATVR